MAGDCREWPRMAMNGLKNGRRWMEIDGNGREMTGNGQKKPELAGNGRKWSEITRVGWEWSGNDQKWPEVTGDCQE